MKPGSTLGDSSLWYMTPFTVESEVEVVTQHSFDYTLSKHTSPYFAENSQDSQSSSDDTEYIPQKIKKVLTLRNQNTLMIVESRKN